MMSYCLGGAKTKMWKLVKWSVTLSYDTLDARGSCRYIDENGMEGHIYKIRSIGLMDKRASNTMTEWVLGYNRITNLV